MDSSASEDPDELEVSLLESESVDLETHDVELIELAVLGLLSEEDGVSDVHGPVLSSYLLQATRLSSGLLLAMAGLTSGQIDSKVA